jgi:hypothetical protein
MKQVENSIATRIITTIIIVIVILLVLFIIGLFTREVEGQSIPQSKYDARMLELDKLALDDAYHAQLRLLFSVWLKDDPADISRITRGLNNARHAYVTAADKIAQREAKQ